MQEVAFVMSAPDFVTNQTIQKPWGSYTDFIRESGIVLKEIVVSSGKRLSLQAHNKRKEYWIVFEGTGKAIVGEKEVILSKETIVQVGVGQKHRIINDSGGILRIAEIQLGECLETDVIRYEDDYGREGTNS